ncbi:type II secretion system protein GspC [Yersinia enterocolitica]|uniref:type II secretion system protein GspC n=1 Tax=Yersinia enterocolitica TaxID=630 RepID=UPI003AB3C2D4
MATSIEKTVLGALTQYRVLFVIILLICVQLFLLNRQITKHNRDSVNLTQVSFPQGYIESTKKRESMIFNLFGSTATPFPMSSATKKTLTSSRHNAPQSKLSINLTGIVSSQNRFNSIAIITTRDNEQLSLGIGDKIPGVNAEISEIFANHIVIDYLGNYESLFLFSDTPSKTKDRTYYSAVLPNDQSQQFQQKILNYLTIAPMVIDNQLVGYRPYPGQQEQLFYQAGLQDNDLVVAINGLDLHDIQQAQQALKKFPELSEVTLTIERDGQLHDIFISSGDN